MARTVAVIQARMGSARFPGKMIAPLGGYPIIEWVLRRTLRASSLADVVLATSTGPENDVLAEHAARLGVNCFRGHEADVLSRFVDVARMSHADEVIRICADNPFVAPEEIDRLVAFYDEDQPAYAFNHVPRLENRYPDGLGAEIFDARLLDVLDTQAVSAPQREHVTLYVWENAGVFEPRTFAAPAEIAFPEVRLDVDTPEDLERLAALGCVTDIDASGADVVNSYLTRYPVRG